MILTIRKPKIDKTIQIIISTINTKEILENDYFIVDDKTEDTNNAGTIIDNNKIINLLFKSMSKILIFKKRYPNIATRNNCIICKIITYKSKF